MVESLTKDEVEKLKEQLGEALLSLQNQRQVLLAYHKKQRDQVNAKIKEVGDKIIEAEKYKKPTL